jgi:hypothetical protein
MTKNCLLCHRNFPELVLLPNWSTPVCTQCAAILLAACEAGWRDAVYERRR